MSNFAETYVTYNCTADGVPDLARSCEGKPSWCTYFIQSKGVNSIGQFRKGYSRDTCIICDQVYYTAGSYRVVSKSVVLKYLQNFGLKMITI